MAADTMPCELGRDAHSAAWFQCGAQLESWAADERVTAPYMAPITIQGLSALADHDVGCSSNCVCRHKRLLSVTSAAGSCCPSARLVLPTRRRALLPFSTYMLLARCQQHSMSTFPGRLTLAKAQESKLHPFEFSIP